MMPAASEADTRSVEARGAEKSHRRGAASSGSDQVRGVTGRMGAVWRPSRESTQNTPDPWGVKEHRSTGTVNLPRLNGGLQA